MSRRGRRPAAIAFDNDGLLLDTEEAWTRAELILFGRRGLAFTMEHKRDLIGSSRVVAAAKLEAMLDVPGEGLALMDELHELVMEEALHDIPVRPGALDLLAAIREAGVPVALASNSARAFVERTLHGAGLDGAFAIVVTAEDVAHGKPEPDIYLEACRLLGAAPRDCTALEDSPPGVAAAHAAGMYVVGVPYLDVHLPEADLVAASLGDPAVYAALGLDASAPTGRG
jgi:HAD superfamily hydrolase (TIGR01509 family)